MINRAFISVLYGPVLCSYLHHFGGRLCLLYRIYFTVAAYITLVGIYDCSIGSCLLQLLISQPLYLLYKIPFFVVTSQRAFMHVL